MTLPLWGAVESQGNSRDQDLPRGGYVPLETATACQHTRLTLEMSLSRMGGGLSGPGCELGLPGGSRALFGESGFPEGTAGARADRERPIRSRCRRGGERDGGERKERVTSRNICDSLPVCALTLWGTSQLQNANLFPDELVELVMYCIQ